MKEEMPVYVFTGFLEAGKTRFIQQTLEDPRFMNGEKTLIILCEEGEEELDLSKVKNTYIEHVENEGDLSPVMLEHWEDKYHAERVIVEYNGMWQLASMYTNFPEHWLVYQELMFADATTFMTYNANMRSLMMDKLMGAELVVFNRFANSMDKLAFHQIARAANRRIQICYEYENGFTEYDDIEDPLPFDIDAPVIELDLMDYALWYRDASEDPKKYDGKVIHLQAMAARNRRLPDGCFVFGRPVMTCCEADIQFMGFVTQNKSVKPIEMPAWYDVTAKIAYKFNRLYGKKGPVLAVQEIRSIPAPEKEVATFY